MKRRICLILAALLLVMAFCLPAGAATTGTAEAGFVQGEEVFAWFRLADDDPSGLSVQVQIGDVLQNGKEVGVTPYKESGLPVHYYILLDRSTSMPWYRDQVEDFVDTLLDDTGMNTRTTIATFGDAFEVELSAAVDKDAVMKKLRSIQYDEERTNLYKGIDDALQDISLFRRNRGELIQLILITDGIPVEQSELPTPQDVAERIASSPEVVFHSFMLGQADDAALYMSSGVHSRGDSEQAAKAILTYTESLYAAVFKPAQVPAAGRTEMQFIFKHGMEYSLTCQLAGVPVLGETDSSGGGTVSLLPDVPGGTSSQGEGPVSEPPASESEDGTVTEPESDGETPGAGLAEIFRGIGTDTWVLIGVIGGVVLVLIVVLVVVLMLLSRRKKRRGAAKRTNRTPPPGAVPLRIEVLDGHCLRVRCPLYVADDLFIGTDPNGGIVWDAPEMAAQNTRLFLQDGVLYIEDLHSPQGTALDGMRIFAPNRLYSGEIISIGTVQFRLYFGETNQ